MKQIIKRKDGIEYERRINDLQCNTNINIRINKETLDEFKTICAADGAKYSDKVRTLIEDYIRKERKKSVGR